MVAEVVRRRGVLEVVCTRRPPVPHVQHVVTTLFLFGAHLHLMYTHVLITMTSNVNRSTPARQATSSPDNPLVPKKGDGAATNFTREMDGVGELLGVLLMDVDDDGLCEGVLVGVGVWLGVRVVLALGDGEGLGEGLEVHSSTTHTNVHTTMMTTFVRCNSSCRKYLLGLSQQQRKYAVIKMESPTGRYITKDVSASCSANTGTIQSKIE